MNQQLCTAAFLVIVSWFGACSAPAAGSATTDAPVAQARPLPALESAIEVRDARGEELAFAALLDRLAEADVVFLGETHLDDTTHRVEAAVLEGLRTRRDGKVVLSLEMFERDVQRSLDDYLAGKSDEATFLAAARPWSNYRTDYRPLIECAREHGLPVVAANAPAALRRKVSAGGRAALDALAPEERRLFPAEILPADAAYWQRVDRATRGHMNFASQPDEQRLWSGQNLWDNCMGAACADALAAHPGSSVLHVVGGFHVMYGSGTAAQLRQRASGVKIAIVEIMTAPPLHSVRPERDAERADYLVYAAELARSVSDGTHAVAVPGELAYTVDVPPSATEAARAPLLVWLPDGDECVEDARALLVAALGDEAAIAVLEPPYPERASDLGPGGRWTRPNAFRSDQARVQQALERLVEYVTRRLPADGARVVVAGRGSGATTALWSAMYSDWLDARFVALAPRGAGALRMEGLPDRAPVTRDLRVLVAPGTAADADWIRADYAGVGVPTELAELGADAPIALQIEVALRSALGLPPRASTGDAAELCVLERELPRARQWAEVFARRLTSHGRPARVVLADALRGDEDPTHVHRMSIGGEWPLASYSEGRGIPLAQGDFGGTTVLVVPAGASTDEQGAWLALERDKALKKRSPFAGLRVALVGGTPGLAQVLGELHESGARSVLVVPAVFCASPAEMRELESSLDEHPELLSELDLAWLPGLGAELCCAPEDE